MPKSLTLKICFSIFLLVGSFASSLCSAASTPLYGKNFYKSDGSPRTMVIFLYEGITVQDYVGIYNMFNFASGPDLNIVFAAKQKGILHDDRGRMKVVADKSIFEIQSADIFVVPGGLHGNVLKDPASLAWVKKMYDSSEYTASICTGAIILAASKATIGKAAGTAWALRGSLAPLGVTYVPTPPPSVDGKYYSAAGAAAGAEIGLKLMEKITGSPALSQISEFAIEWNPQMLYGSGDPERASTEVRANFEAWLKSDPVGKDLP